MSVRLICALLAPLLLNACALQLRVPLDQSARSSTQSLRAHVAIIQDEIIVDVPPSMSVGAGVMFGALGAIITSSIDSAVTNNRMKANQSTIESFYPQIDDIDFRKDFGDTMTKRMGEYPLKITEVFTTPLGLTQKELQKKMENYGPNEALLLVYPYYRLTGDYRYLFGMATMTIWIKGKDTLQYRGQAIYQSQPVGPGGPESLALWSNNNAASFRANMQELVNELVDMTLTDVNLDAKVRPEEVKTFPIGARAIGMPPQATGKVISERNGRVRVLAEEGWHFSVPTSEK